MGKLFPAYAGVIPNVSITRHDKQTFPRICGGDPADARETEDINIFSPHMRG